LRSVEGHVENKTDCFFINVKPSFSFGFATFLRETLVQSGLGDDLRPRVVWMTGNGERKREAL
jgi:hypothetical protein